MRRVGRAMRTAPMSGLHQRLLPSGSSSLLFLAALLAAVAVTLGLPGAPDRAAATSSGANGKIAFDSDRGANIDIYTMNPDGSAVTRLTTDPAADFEPTWSPGGRQIAFTSRRDGNDEIY